MTTESKIRDQNPQHINIEATKISALSLGKVGKTKKKNRLML